MALDEASVARTEKTWASAMIVASLVILLAIIYAGIGLHMAPPGNIETVDPNTLHIEGEFVDSNLGTHVDPSGAVTARLVATQFAFQPECLVVPQNTQVTFRAVSPDVLHGLIILGTNVNTMVVPGFVSQVRTVFDKTGDMLMPCHEFCGLGHSQMLARVRVVPIQDFNPDENGKVSCNER